MINLQKSQKTKHSRAIFETSKRTGIKYRTWSYKKMKKKKKTIVNVENFKVHHSAR